MFSAGNFGIKLKFKNLIRVYTDIISIYGVIMTIYGQHRTYNE